ncbi:hypothetical protein A3A93_01730 [Candidatus Roizmanbacteria bacterium RIFCSPLOWO2_01_FULL_38_12]|uniref:Phosphoribosyltransferase domain-containing protein n=1 Tax=Candidatus Roizmanbacteria bacterium RIFCSPLOWO2_01_FULL_38_12 TaxID=1802061 RepID=A0A1F7IY91_9BACT|nr:MAG: hypothetical protein A2861_02270 [Candidatus Roizmanbacteria bacterium RIFCSPHIGHO2_01_FULL_38_15]OGK34509.1 MAG: hypothetical protein A3F59_04255 [Candidatus Roizmanbacteria bacterium RIFCSPHIGHO2_12_FULL_38_13]OGK48338.1 MAG: hypothetical protein A3A93_01730 [Candidatus Roizmanbacteria bacterium RIFCSPLOWO2_01_FULL_38_12]
MFEDRADAGRKLGKKLLKYKKDNPVVLALPRGGVEVGYEVAKILKSSLEVLVVRKLGAPHNREFAIGAITEDNVIFIDEDTINSLNIPQKTLEDAIAIEKKELKRRVNYYRKGKKIKSLKNKTVIIVDDGLATGATAKAAIPYVKTKKTKKIVFATPVSARDSLEKIKKMVDNTISVITTEYLSSISEYYRYFPQTQDVNVVILLDKSK